MYGDAYLVYVLPLDCEGVEARCNHSTCLYLAAGAADDHPITVGNAAFLGKIRAYLNKHCRLQFVQPAIET